MYSNYGDAVVFSAIRTSKIAAEFAGGMDEDSRRTANFVGENRAGNTRRAAMLAERRQERGSDLPLREIGSAWREPRSLLPHFALACAAAVFAIPAHTIRENCGLVRGCSPKHSRKSAKNGVVVVNTGTFRESLSELILIRFRNQFSMKLSVNVKHLFEHLFRF
ncbi:MAG: hypothetical protein ABI690_29780 [Chloroflexota bacterium]